ncbi:Glycoside hydrolase family 43 [Neofusicoccum parvum]|uniref:Glycoside hydrolase family 43 n=1 Tax=Neofusicoccum parvum TaxID=310453 RepID=A0ACB5SN40_9PEZI|nr:Glycoside hydrolase family 43 [Neofusicoccum parvum]GME49333.1 Glycoside hydrolase family 43 [Neofusicoccum parvum]
MRPLMSLICWALWAQAQLVGAATYSNPLKNPNGSDPHIVWSGGYYYLMTTTWTNLQITRATTLNGLKNGETKTVWTDTNSARCCNVWAPELHYFDGTWYIYYTAGNSANLDGQRPHVLKGGATPWDSWSYLAQLTTTWGIDGTVLRFTSGNYFVYSCMSNSLQSLCIAPLTSPGKVGTSKVLSQPTASWETVGAPVQEGPAAMYHGGKTYLTYSASYCWTTSYQLGLLTWDGSGDPTASGSWKKTGPVFKSANGNYGTGHNGFFQSPDGTEIWNVYHATSNSGGSCDGNRYTMAQKVNWNSDGSPNFGTAAALGTTLAGPSGE